MEARGGRKEGRGCDPDTRGEEEGFWVEVEEGKAAQGGGVVGVRYGGGGQSTSSLATCGVRASAARLSDTHSHIPPPLGK